MQAGRTRGKIRPPRRSLNTDNEDINFEKMWSTLASALREIHTMNASALSFEELYRNAYKLVLKKKGEYLYVNVKNSEQTWLSQQVRSKIKALVSSSLLTDSSRALGVIGNEKQLAGERFLRGLREAWESHNTCTNMITDVLMYMDRQYCEHNGKPSIFTASMGLFRDFILRSPLESADTRGAKVISLLTSVILEQIQMDRDGHAIDKNLIRSCLYMLEGLYETDDEHEFEKLYLTDFEPKFLEASQNFYRSEAKALVGQADAVAFLRHTERRLAEEDARCQSTIAAMTSPKIKSVVEQGVIKEHIVEVVEMEGNGAAHMFDNDRYDELKLLYDLISRVDDKKGALDRTMHKRVVALGTDINNAAKATAHTGDDKADAEVSAKSQGQTPGSLQTSAAIQWVEGLIQLKDKYDAIWVRSLDKDHFLQASLTRALTTVINNFNRGPEYLSLFIDDNLRRGLKGKTENEVDEVLDKAVVLLRYVRDKDLFERYYKKHLSKRLLGGRSMSHDIERHMVSKLKLEIGNYFTQKLEGMFKDMAVSEELTTDFRAYVSHLKEGDDRRAVELGINVLTATFWPIDVLGPPSSSEENASRICIFPPALEHLKAGFEKFYLGKHTGRRLTWQANAGSADVRVVFPAVPGRGPGLGKDRRHELNVSTYAMVILLLFNDVPRGGSLSFDEIQARTTIPSGELVRNLQSLAVAPKTRVLLKEPMSKDVKPSDLFSFNEGFTSKFLKIKVGVVAGPSKIEGEKERKDTEKKNDEMRGGLIEAAIVRIMKGRKQCSHQSLCSEVIAQLTSRFVPDVQMLKRRIESLIEREYLERMDDKDRPMYQYLA